MNNIIELDNSYYIEILNRNNEIPVNTVDICHLSLIKVLKSKNIVLRIDFDKLQVIFEMTKILNKVTDENQDCEKILKLFLNTIYVLDKYNKDIKLVVNTFKIKLFALLGFAPRQDKCANCSKPLLEDLDEFVYYDYIDNKFVCENCKDTVDSKRRIRISKATYNAIFYVIRSDIKKIFSFELKSYVDYDLFGQVFMDATLSGL